MMPNRSRRHGAVRVYAIAVTPNSQSPSPRPRVRSRRDSDPQPLRRSNRIRSRERPHSMDLTVAEIQQISSRRRGRDPSAVVPRKERRLSVETKASTTGDNVIDQQFIGLINNGFTCYLNVILILLVTIPFYRDLIMSIQFNAERLQTNAMAVLQYIIRSLISSPERSVPTIPLTRLLGYPDDIQQDVHEVFNSIVDAIDVFFSGGSISSAPPTPARDIISGSRIVSFKCGNPQCTYGWQRSESFSVLQIPIIGSTLVECLNGEFNVAGSPTDEEYKCDRSEGCQTSTYSVTQVLCASLPEVLVISLTRFKSVFINAEIHLNKNIRE